ncbi:MAG TPA: GNAT family N-acetyltransferase [Thermoplasmata archaeon]|nr:GNAT family N-acetyltransferase [Thermoplasmata archaeon]
MTDDRRRALDTVLATLETACEVTDEPWGTFVVNPEFHRIHMANFLWLRDLPRGGVAEAVRRIEEMFTPLRIPDRRWFVERKELAVEIEPELVRRGYTRRSEHLMFGRRAPTLPPNPAVAIRPARDQATRDDHDEVAGLLHEEDGYDHEVSHQLLGLNWRRQAGLGSAVFVAYLEGRPVGNMSFDAIDGVGELYEVETVPAMRGRGVAATMVLAARERAEGRALSPFFLRTTVGHTTYQMYEKLGFVREGFLDGFLRASGTAQAPTTSPGSAPGSSPR